MRGCGPNSSEDEDRIAGAFNQVAAVERTQPLTVGETACQLPEQPVVDNEVRLQPHGRPRAQHDRKCGGPEH